MRKAAPKSDGGMRIVIVNTHSVLNPGDAAIVLAELQVLQERYPSLAVSITSRTPELDREFYAPLGVAVRPAVIPAPSLYDGWRPKLAAGLKNLLNLRAKKGLWDDIRRSDLIISSGGGYFYSNKRHLPGLTFRQSVAHIRLARRLKKPVVFFPQSFGPVSSASALRALKRSLSGTHVLKILARDQGSFDLARTLIGPEDAAAKLDLCPDVAFLLPGERGLGPPPFPQGFPRPRMMVTLRHWDYPEARGREEKKKREDAYLSACAEICRRYYERWRGSVVVFPQVKGPGSFEDDRPVSKVFWDMIERLIPGPHRLFLDEPRLASPSDVLAAVSHVDIVLATRTHSAIMALVAGVPVISLGYQPKATGTLRLLGLERFAAGIGDIDPRKVGDLVDEILNDPAAVRDKITKNLAEVRKTITRKLGAALGGAD